MSTRGLSVKQKEKYAKVRIRQPLVVPLLPMRHTTVPADRLGDLQIGGYQRLEVRGFVGDLVHAMSSGGMVPEPTKLARRVDGSLWIVDGQQRWHAHCRVKKPMPVIVYDVPDAETESLLFTIFNTTTRLNANYQVNAWPGESAEFIRALNAKPDSQFFEQVDLGRGGARRFSAAIMAKMMAAVCGAADTAWRGPIAQSLQVLDAEFHRDSQRTRDRSLMMLTLATRVFTGGERHFRYLPAIALAVACRVKWETSKKPLGPTPAEIAVLSRANWKRIIPSFDSTQLPTAREYILKRWKSG